MSQRVRLTTVDNPFNPFKDFNSWFLFDIEKGYYTCSKLARLSQTNNDMSEQEEQEAIEDAIDRLIEIDPFDIYRKVYEGDNTDRKKDAMGGGS